MKVYTYSHARQHLASILDQASREGAVQIRRRDGRVFLVQPVVSRRSPLDVPGVRTDITTAEIIEVIREGRRGRPFASGRSPKGVRPRSGATN